MANILCVNKLSPRGLGGAETRLREVSGRFAKAGHRVYIICGKARSEEPSREVLDGVDIRSVRVLPDWLLRRFPPGHYLPQALFYLVSPLFVLRALRQWKIDVVRDSMSPFPALGILAPFCGPRAVVVTHILYATLLRWIRYYGMAYGLAGYLAETALLRGWLRYSCVITDSHWLARDILKRASCGMKVQAALNGIQTEQFVKRKGRRPSGGPFRLLNAARFTHHKRQDDLIRACALLAQRGCDIELSLAGDGPLRSQLERLVIAQGVQGAAHFLGAVPRERMKSLYAEYDALVITSESEGLPVVLLEAMASRLPVIAPDAPYVNTLAPDVRSMMATYSLRDVPSLADVIAGCIRSPDLCEKREAQAWDWVQKLRWDDVAAKELEALCATGERR